MCVYYSFYYRITTAMLNRFSNKYGEMESDDEDDYDNSKIKDENSDSESEDTLSYSAYTK